ncbi:MAG: ABC transporter permease subunit [Oscillospiraceae bacterium]|nr:ABC transporter permease subunit [Oscillospiraceae bacterium]
MAEYEAVCKKKKRGVSVISKRTKLRKMIEDYDLYLLILPGIIYLLIFAYGPMSGLQLAFRDYRFVDGIWGSPWVGFAHFERFFNMFLFREVMVNTVLISIYSIIFGFPVPIIMALLLNHLRSKIFVRTFRTVSYAPHFISMVIMVGMLIFFLNPRTGVVNIILSSLGFDTVNFMARPQYFRTIFIASSIWQGSGFAMIIYTASLSSVDPALYEAADIDGASKLNKILHIDLPTLKPTIIILLILSIGNLMNVGFERVFLMQNDLNIGVSEIIPTYVYRAGLLRGNHDFATAVGLFNTVVNFGLLVSANWISRKVAGTSLW